VGNDFLVQALLGTLGLVATASLFVRLRDAKGKERQQLKWCAYAATVLSGGIILGYTVSRLIGTPWLSWVGFTFVMAGAMGIPVAVIVAILQYRLYDIDLIINRTLVYGSLTASVVGLYVLLVGGLGVFLQARGNFVISLLATGLVAVLFQPLRERLQRGVNRLMYGERDELYKVLSRLGHRLEGTLAPDTALKTIVETVAQALKLPLAAIALEQDGGFVTAAEHGTSAGDPTVLPLTYQTEPVGRLILAPRVPGEAFTLPDRRLLDDLARQAGAAVHAVRLTAALQRSRERLVTAREEERRRLRRDLHDGLGPTLAGLAFGLDAARGLLTREPKDADALLAELKARIRAGVVNIRRLV
jgi:signal transduction histidine kinase